MLWTDADFITTDDLVSFDPELRDVAEAESIVLEGDGGVVRRGVEDAGRQLERRLVSFSNLLSNGGISANHLAAVFYTGGQATQQRRTTLEQVVVTGRNATYLSEAKHWALVRTLMFFYRTAVNRASNDRYASKLDRFRQDEQQEIWPTFRKSGVPIVHRPMPCPEAVQGFSPGTFAVSTAAAAGTAGTWDVAVTYVDGTKYVSKTSRGNGESHPSATKRVTTTSGQRVAVDATNLNPPAGALTEEMRARGATIPLTATSWNVYVGAAGGTLYLQNATPIPIATRTYTLAGGPVLSGYDAGLGQHAESFVTIMDLLQRG